MGTWGLGDLGTWRLGDLGTWGLGDLGIGLGVRTDLGSTRVQSENLLVPDLAERTWGVQGYRVKIYSCQIQPKN